MYANSVRSTYNMRSFAFAGFGVSPALREAERSGKEGGNATAVAALQRSGDTPA